MGSAAPRLRRARRSSSSSASSAASGSSRLLPRACRAEPLERRTLLAVAPVGPEVEVSTLGTTPAVASDRDGNFVVVWQSIPIVLGTANIVGRRYDWTGAPLGDPFSVNTYADDEQTRPDVAMDADGDFVVVWQSHGQDGDGWGVYAQRVSPPTARAAAARRASTT